MVGSVQIISDLDPGGPKTTVPEPEHQLNLLRAGFSWVERTAASTNSSTELRRDGGDSGHRRSTFLVATLGG
jgi:hypothetical protein